MLKIKALISRVVLLPVAGVYQKDTINSGRQWEGAGLAPDGSTPGRCRMHQAWWEQVGSWRVRGSGAASLKFPQSASEAACDKPAEPAC